MYYTERNVLYIDRVRSQQRSIWKTLEYYKKAECEK